MAVFVAYSDESEDGKSGGRFFMGGLVARDDLWAPFASIWQDRVLAGTPIIPYMHMREIRNEAWRANKGSGINYDESQRRVGLACETLGDFIDMAAIVASIEKSAVQRQIIGRFSQRKGAPALVREVDYYCFVAYATIVVRMVRQKWPEATVVNFVVSTKQGITKNLQGIRDEIKKALDPELRDILGDVYPASMDLVLPLQCSDVFLWHIKRHYDADWDHKKMVAADAFRLDQIMRGETRDSCFYDWTESDIADMAATWERQDILPKK